jgi:hypothetical protein
MQFRSKFQNCVFLLAFPTVWEASAAVTNNLNSPALLSWEYMKRTLIAVVAERERGSWKATKMIIRNLEVTRSRVYRFLIFKFGICSIKSALLLSCSSYRPL